MTSLAMNDQCRIIGLLDTDTERSHRFHRASAIVTRQEALDLAGSVRERSQNNSSMGDTFVSWYYNLRFDMRSPSNT
jgi:hypothetical protein